MYYKNGRPLKGYENKSHIITFRMEPYEYQELQNILRLTKHTKTEAIRIGLRLYEQEVKRQLGGQNE